MIEEDKVTLMRTRAELIESLAARLSNDDRVRTQTELSVVNAKIKALNTIEAARLKAAADRRKAAGLAEAQANAARARINGPRVDDLPEEAPPGQTEVIDGWIDAVLLRHDIDFTRTRAGTLTIDGAAKWASVLGMLIDGIYATARGQELPPLPNPEPKPTKPAKPRKR